MKFFNQNIVKTLLILVIFVNNGKLLKATDFTKIHCNRENISVEILLPKDELQTSEFYLKSTHNNSLMDCQPKYYPNGVVFNMDLNRFFKCGLVRTISKIKNQISYHQTIIMKQNGSIISSTNIKCSYKIGMFRKKPKHKLVRRDALPDDFKENDDVEILETLQQQAPEPQLLMEVRQNDQLIDGMVTVIPGTPLIMQVKLNDTELSVYGLNVNYLEVSDTRDMSETIIFRGCTVDPYLFENFNVSEGHTLTSKFRAFKFPNTSFVQFRANVQICLKKCPDPQCSNSQQGQTRRKREVFLHEISLNLLLHFDETIKGNQDELFKLQNHVKFLKFKNLSLRKF